MVHRLGRFLDLKRIPHGYDYTEFMRNLKQILLLAFFLPILTFARGALSGYCTQGGQTVTVGAATSSTKVMQSYPQCSVTIYNTGGPSGTVTTSTTAVTWVSGTPFNANGQWSGLAITINSVSYTISSCSSATACTLTGSAGTQSSPVAYSLATTAPAAIFTSNGSARANPFTASLQGFWQFYADNGAYDVKMSGGGIPVPFTWGAQGVIDPGVLSSLTLSGTASPLVSVTTSGQFGIESTAASEAFYANQVNGIGFYYTGNGVIVGGTTTGHTLMAITGASHSCTMRDDTGWNCPQLLDPTAAPTFDGLTLTGPVSLVTAGPGTTLNVVVTGPAGRAANFGQTTSGGTPTVIITNGGTDPALSTGLVWAQTVNYIATENGANNAIACAVGSGPGLLAGLVVTVQLAHTLQAGANTFAYVGGTALAIKSHFNTANNIATAYAATGTITLQYNGAIWKDLSQ